MVNTKRKKQITFRLSDTETAILYRKIQESGLNQQEYLRKAALEKEIVNLKPIREILPEMKKQGNNLNQIAKALNYRQFVDYDRELNRTLQEVRSAWQLLKQYLVMHP